MKLKTTFKIVAYYISFGILWIIFSDRIIYLMTDSVSMHSSLQTYKGLFFILLTSILLYKLIEDNLKDEKHDKDVILEKELQLEQINKSMNHLFNLSIKMLGPVEYSDKSFIKEIFRLSTHISDINDFGCAYMIDKCKIDFIDSIGFDSKELKKMTDDINLYKISPEKIIIQRYEKKDKNRELPWKKIKESIYVSIYKNEKIIGGFNIHIGKGSNKNYSDDFINRMQVIQDLSNGFYKIKKYSDYKSMLQNDIVQSFIATLEFHDIYTKGHSDLVARYSMKIGEALKLDKKQLENLYWAATMHDMGKIVIPTEILNKVGKLTNSEFNLIKKHPEIGYEIMSRSSSLKVLSKYVLHHHERWDGKGYPSGLKGNEIPLLSQIISVADCWHAMTSDRAYKSKLSDKEGIEELIQNRGTQFSPKIIDVFLEKKCYKL